jgi:hypothetical protein
MANSAPDSRHKAAAQDLIDATLAIAGAGVPLMLRVVPGGDLFRAWDHYPPDDAVDAVSGARWFYHAHAPGERDAGEHGHFHLFFDLSRVKKRGRKPLAGPPGGVSSGADVVHIAAIGIDLNGLPTRIFTVNRWVTDEWLYSAADIAAQLAAFDLGAATGDALVNRWLTAAVGFFRGQIEDALQSRDAEIARWGRSQEPFEDRRLELLSSIAIDINSAVAAAG